MKRFAVLLVVAIALVVPCRLFAQSSSDWVKYENNPVLGGDLGVCFDVSLIREDGVFKMWFSWRTKHSIGYTESADGVNWSEPVVVLAPRDSGWENLINRCGVVRKGDLYYMWYTGQTDKTSQIGFATSKDGIKWERRTETPVLKAEAEWEKVAVMCPDVQWDEEEQLFIMRYSGGEQYEPNAIGYATSKDGLHWTKYANNPIFAADPKTTWEQHKVTAGQVVKRGDWFYMFYIGFENEHLARIGIARSKDGISNWDRLKANPIVSPDQDKWDGDACYKPFAIYDEKEDLWRLWYNGRKGNVEQIGMVVHKGEDLGFEKK
ncbi:MAG: hypothetical protein IJM30_05080 [Thermoguttaceae bacterium]|nr:hypothetical protein [Thermoguttaceae bacterium]